MVHHQNRHVIDRGIADGHRVRRGAGGFIFGQADLTEEDLGLGNHAGRWLDTRDREGGAVRRVSVAAGLGLGLAFHDGEVRHALGGALVFAGELHALHVHEAHLLERHEAFGNESRSAEHEVVADADGEVAAIAVGIFAGPHALADVHHPLLELDDGRRVEERVDLRRGLRVLAGSPMKFVVGKDRLDVGGWRGRTSR